MRAAVSGRDIPDELGPLLAERIARATALWPDVHLDEDHFVRAVAERLPGEDPVRTLHAMQTDDLYLACACAAGDPCALDDFERYCGPVIHRALASTGAAIEERADLLQVVRQRLLVAPAQGGAPRIATYSARGSLRGWVRVVAIREAARMLPRARRERAAEHDELAGLIAGSDNPEVGYFKRLYREEFKQAFHTAVEALDDRARLLLQQAALDGLSVDQLAALHGVHRATAARWVQAAREAVLIATQRALLWRLRLSRTELASVMRLIQSQLDLSLTRVLRWSA